MGNSQICRGNQKIGEPDDPNKISMEIIQSLDFNRKSTYDKVDELATQFTYSMKIIKINFQHKK